MSSYCTCTHAIELHQHDRAGTDCATCDCAEFRRPVAEEGPSRTVAEVDKDGIALGVIYPSGAYKHVETVSVDDANALEDYARECAAAYGHLATAWTQFADEVADAIEHATAEYDPATDYPEPEDDWEMAR